MMRWFRDLAIRTKLVLVMMLTACVAVALAGGAWIVHEVTSSRKMAEQDLGAQARIIGENCAAALEFDDSRTAQETLAALKTRVDIVAACVYRNDGSVLASYPVEAASLSTRFPWAAADDQRLEGGHLLMARRVIRKGQTLGTVYLRSNLQPYYSRLTAGIAIALGTMLVSVILVSLLVSRLHLVISRPILNLATVTDQVSKQQDYKLRATKHGNDEIGTLTDGFNHMLEQIQERDTKLHLAYRDLQFSEQRFRQLAESIHEVFWMTDLEKSEMIYISPGYERVWGRTCQSLYANPHSWLEAIHPQDRERTTSAALSEQSDGSYDEEYRIIRSDGAVRWIHDRAFPIRDASGKVYRIAGIAEDITERKRTEETLRQLSARLLKAQDEERRRIAFELHEGTGQDLTALSMHLAALEPVAGKFDGPAQKDVAEAVSLTKKCSHEIRTLSYLLHPPMLDEDGLDPALQWFVDGFAQRSGIRVDLEISPNLERLPQEVEIALFRIVQESLANAHRHAGSSTAAIRLSADQSSVRLTVQDAGKGFPIASGGGRNPTTWGIGIAGMHERVKQLGGHMEIDSRNSGTTILVTIPLNGNAP